MTAQTLHAFAVPLNSAVLTSGGQLGPWESQFTRFILPANNCGYKHHIPVFSIRKGLKVSCCKHHTQPTSPCDLHNVRFLFRLSEVESTLFQGHSLQCR